MSSIGTSTKQAHIPSLGQLFQATRNVRAATHGRRAVNTVRPRGPYGILRSRAPLTVVLYAAAREGRLVWRTVESFAVLDPPQAWRKHMGRAGIRSRLLGLIERQWEMAVFLGSILLALAAALVMLPFRALWPVILLLGALIICGATAMTVLPLLWGGFAVLRYLFRPLRGDQIAAQDLPGWHWSMPLCHQADPDGADDLLRLISLRLRKLVASSVADAGGDLGVVVRSVEVTETLVCLRNGVTTDAMDAAISAASARIQPYGCESEVAFIVTDEQNAALRSRPPMSGRFFFWYLAAAAFIVCAEAYFIAGWEHAACHGSGCTNRPATYFRALTWLGRRLVLSNSPDLMPATTQTRLVGLTTMLMVLTLPPIGVLSAYQVRRSRDIEIERISKRIRDVTRQPTVLILVATNGERDSVLAAIRAANQEQPHRTYPGQHTVFAAGTVGGARLCVAQSEQGMLSPGASTLTAHTLIDELSPDYLILVGICYGLRDGKQQIGDILVADQLRVMDPKKIVDPKGAGHAPIEISRGDRVMPSVTLLDRFRSATVDWAGSSVHFGPVLSLNTLVNSEYLRARLIESEPDAIGGEMEGGGVYAAAAKEKVDWILVKAISDWGVNKTDDGQELAAHNVARFVVHTIRAGGFSLLPSR